MNSSQETEPGPRRHAMRRWVGPCAGQILRLNRLGGERSGCLGWEQEFISG
jgi:hypothetical protein